MIPSPRRSLLALALVLAGPRSLEGQGVEAWLGAQPGEALQVYLVTVGQGDEIWERFGHNAIFFEEIGTGRGLAYHWGIFDFDQVDFVPRLIRGQMLYSMGPSDLESALAEYERAGRQVRIQRLALTAPEKTELLRLVQENALPRNRDYLYDYYGDNCSTRLRDALDQVLGGRLRDRFSSDTTAYTYRWHTRRILQDRPPYYLGIQFVLGPRADRPITVWEEMFLPRTLMERMRDVRVPDPEGGDRPLVEGEGLLLESGRPDPPDSPPFALPIFLLVGLLWGGGMAGLAWWGQGDRLGRRWGITLLAGGWAILAFAGGSILLGAWLFTDHVFWHRNLNLFQTNPLFLLALAPLFLFLRRGELPRWGRYLLLLLALLSLGGAFLQLLPGLGQRNLEILALTLPVNLGLGITGLRAGGRPGDPSKRPGS